jgi:putative ABC transport system permease protein
MPEVEHGNNVCIIGSEMAKTLFKKDYPIDKEISVGAGKYIVIGC